MYSDPSGYFTIPEFSVSKAVKSVLETIQNNKLAMTVWSGFIGGFIAVGDQLSTGNLNPKDLLLSFGKGFIAGFAFAVVSMFLPVKIMMAISGLGVIGGFAGAVKSFADGEFWQGIYRASVSTLAGVGWYKAYGGYVKNWTNNLFKSVRNFFTPKIQNGSISTLPQNVQNSYNAYDKAGWKNHSGQTPGTKTGKTYSNRPTKNSNTTLPTKDANGNQNTYAEYDVNNRIPGAPRDSERFVVGSDGSVYYTDSHYGDKPSPTGLPDFIQIK